ncbi:MAG: hypothetical protein LBH24_02005 [Clostridiales bacterium]|jgi:hypothetical protein|nr:hypothetical protein [Clostridiales bacterium]
MKHWGKTIKVWVLIMSILTNLRAAAGCAVDKPIEDGVLVYENNAFQMDAALDDGGFDKNLSLLKTAATDDFSRAMGPITGYKTDKERYVGLFYFLWHGYHAGQQTDIYDISKLLDENYDALLDTETNAASPPGRYHHWGEPLFGYYHSMDPWVFRKHIELLTFAGVDFLVFDVTNGFDYLEVCEVILPILQEYYDAGWNVPKFMFYTNSASQATVRRLYEGYHPDKPLPHKGELYNSGIYKRGRYERLWFKNDGKPMIVAVTPENNKASDAGTADTVTDAELLQFFSFRESQWPNTGAQNRNANGFPWIDWTRPQHVHTDTINVSVAQHNRLPFSDSLISEAIADLNRGRGYSSEKGADHSNSAVRSGLNFEEQWAAAKERDVKYTFVTGWNEWIALKLVGDPPNPPVGGNRAYFVDTLNEEYSRDAEMMRGGYFDNFYLQTARNIRELKGEKGDTPTGARTTIDIKKGLAQWNAVRDAYFDFTGECAARDHVGMAGTVRYRDGSNRNDIREIRVTHDDDFLYFMVDTASDNVVDLTGGRWMNILLGTEGQGAGRKGYQYLLNRRPGADGVSSVEAISADPSGGAVYRDAGRLNYSVAGKTVQYKIPKAYLKLGDSFTIRFKVLDNVADLSDPESYYTTGDTAPAGRLNYVFSA